MGEYEFFISRIEDMALLSDKKGGSVFSSFLDPSDQMVGGREIGRYKGKDCSFFGGHIYTERKIMSIFKEGHEPEESEYPIKVLKSKEALDVRHQDVLGSILSLSVDRSKVGDINILDDHIEIFVYDTISEFLVSELTKIGGNNVTFYECDINEASVIEPKFKELNIIVPSMRLDAVIGNIFKLSRNEANMFVKGGKVKINHNQVSKPAMTVKVGDMISVRTKGRAIVDSESGQTKKGNTKLLVKKFV
ncbi:RNA-binding protein [Anaerofustis stercorihominis]|uniref:S4 domain protein n=2 Tax=Anaerofustis stercorihominis TaxID=214853 RepID=B1CBW0_9FIRM|nr:YlmH/Sll1252 family protein [Anaerofustis stercorihominis]EDS71757.1 S4 domain protein [Anaerofustis stercorihominis DSM 17244]MCQ4796189.1 YlmH/Sll1252 family protein [Anaerofustis stercorihominis]RGD75165.1 hypothetical protein DW687_02245 [Anaerofustis stercorihominis]